MRVLEFAAQHLWLGCGTSGVANAKDCSHVISNHGLNGRWRTDCLLKPLPGRRLGLVLSMARAYGAAAPHLKPHGTSLKQMHGLICSRTRGYMQQMLLRYERCSHGSAAVSSQQAGAGSAGKAGQTPRPPQKRRRRRLLVPATAAAVTLAAGGGGLALLIACDSDQVQL